MTYEVRQFDLSGVQGLSKKAIDTHLGLYKGYVDNLNKLLEQAAAGGSPLVQDGYNRRFAFEFNGVKLHELFFEQLAGKRQQVQADSDLGKAVKQSFNDFAGWRSKLEALATTRGVGWVLTLRERGTTKLHNFWCDLHHLHMPADSQVVFVLDVWEHAFLLDFAPAQKGEYVKTVLDNVDWSVVEKRFAAGK